MSACAHRSAQARRRAGRAIRSASFSPERRTPMKFVLSIVMVAGFAVLAAAQVAAPEVRIQAVQASVLRNDVVRFSRDVVIKVNGVAIQADEMEGTQAGREFTL